MPDLTINAQRFLADMSDQAQIGSTGDGGVNRPALSEADMQVRGWFEARVRESGLTFRSDGAGNLSGVLQSANPTARTLLLGSHLDSVRHGGRFDGPLGVLSALETLRTIKEANIALPFDLECISFTDEEGTHLPELGSGAFAGSLTGETLNSVRTGSAAFEQALARAGLTRKSILGARRDPAGLRGYIEVHIEQGTRLIEKGLRIGVVSSIVGIYANTITFTGEAAHAGTMPIEKRRDAFLGAAEYALRARELVLETYSPGVTNVGQVAVGPGSFNIVPGRASISVEYRHGDPDTLTAMGDDLNALALGVARGRGLEIEIVPLAAVLPAVMDEDLSGIIRQAADSLGLPHTTLTSFAGHDPQNTSKVTPSAMYFVPSVDGISHNPREFTSDEDCVNAANVMLKTVLRLAKGNES